MFKNNLKNQTALYHLILLHSKFQNRIFLDMAKILIKCGADIDKANEHGETPLHLATKLENQKAFRFLINNGANRFARTKNGETIADFCLQKTIEEMAHPKWVSTHQLESKQNTLQKKLKIHQ